MIAFKRIKNEYTDSRLMESGFNVVYYEDIKFNYDNSPRDREIRDDPLWYFRAVGNAHVAVNKLLAWGKENDKVIIDDYLVRHGPGARTKFMHYEAVKDVGNMPKTTRFPSMQTAMAAVETYPTILKFDQHGRKGMGTFLLREQGDMDKVRNIIEKRREEDAGYTGLGTDWLLQEYVANEGDYRAMIIGHTCIGMYKRRPKKTRVVQNSSNGKARRFKGNRFPLDIAQVAIEGAMALGITVCGVDLVRAASGQPVAIEFNEAPAFRVFEKRVKVDVAEAIANELRRRSV